MPTDIEAQTVITIGPSRANAALRGKAISYQKRQTFSNVCCISLCPFLMVAIAGLLGTFLTGLINKLITVQEFVACSNTTGSLDPNNVPIWNRTDARVQLNNYTAADGTIVFYTNFANVFSTSTNGPPGATALVAQRACSYWYTEDYPLASIYEQDPQQARAVFLRDSSYTPEPLTGWFSILSPVLNGSELSNATQFNNVRSSIIFGGLQQRSFNVWGAAASVDLTKIGVKPVTAAISLANMPAHSGDPAFTNVTLLSSTGILGTIPTRYYLNASNVSAPTFLQVPAYTYYNNSFSLDTVIGTGLQAAIDLIASTDKSALFEGSSSANYTTDVAALVNKLSGYLNVLPYGGIYFDDIDHTTKTYQFTMNYGSDTRISATTTYPSSGARLLVQLTQLSSAILRNANITAGFGSAQITQGVRIMPQVQSSSLNFNFGGLIGSILFPFGVSFLLPIFVINLVQEKEQRILVMMKMNGLKTFAYYRNHYVVMFILFVISIIFFIISGLIFKLSLFTLTNKGVYIILFLLWGNAQIALAFLFSTTFNQSRLALVIVFLLVLCSVIISFVIETLYQYTGQPPNAYFLWPPFAFYRGLALINKRSYKTGSRPYLLTDLVVGEELTTVMIFLAWEIPFYLLLAFYLSQVSPQQFGVRRPWHFPVTDVYDYFTAQKRIKDNGGIDPKAEASIAITVKDGDEELEDDDVRAERARVMENRHVVPSLPSNQDHAPLLNGGDVATPLVMKGMRKVYAGRGGAGPKLAVKDVTFAVERGIVFGLLGPNGAGKTTLISILTGLYEASVGEATLAGFNVKTQTAQVYQNIGICPQFDILWEDLTVYEHLIFYARLKGVPQNLEEFAVRQAMDWVSLAQFSFRLSKGLSGGEKRRLSIAIALLGNPQVVFLDEPTTGLDPEVRRIVWNIVNKARQNKTVILTTHSMEEAEALCQRIGIMAKGRLRCLANPTRLKELYGSGYKAYMNTNEVDTERACAYLEALLPKGWTKVDSFATNVSYEFPAVPGILSNLFQEVEFNKSKYGILDWGVGQTTLEEVFIRLIDEADAAADA